MSVVDSLTTVKDWEGFFDSFKDHLAPVAYEAGPSISYTEPADTVHPEQTAWARQMAKRIYEPVKGRVYVAVGYQLCSTTMIVGDDGIIIVDPGERDGAAAETLADFRRFSDLPIRAVIYTHRHPDHCYAFNGLGITHEDVDSGKVDVIAHETFQKWLINDAGLVAPILSARTALVAAPGFGATGVVQVGLGPSSAPTPQSSHMPTRTVGDKEDLTIAGVRMTIFHAYGDAQDEIDIWLPDFKHVHGSETVQGETFPNLYTLRGTSYRDVELWREGIDTLMEYARQADSYSGSHMRPWLGNGFIVERITNYRDAIQFLHDQSIRHINRGATGVELIDLVAKRLPDHLRDDPWLQPYYGTPEHAVRAIYDGTLGWYNGDPTELAAPLYRERAERYVEALGGRDAVLAKARAALDADDPGWAAELLTHVVRVNTEDMDARRMKAEALQVWGYEQKNIYWRTLALGAARELDGTIKRFPYEFQPPDVIAAIPAPHIVAGLRVRLDPDAANDAHVTIGFAFPDTGESMGIEVRRGVAVIHDGVVPADAAATIAIDAAKVRSIAKDIANVDTVLGAATSVAGDEAAVRTFFGYFDPNPTEPVLLALR